MGISSKFQEKSPVWHCGKMDSSVIVSVVDGFVRLSAYKIIIVSGYDSFDNLTISLLSVLLFYLFVQFNI